MMELTEADESGPSHLHEYPKSFHQAGSLLGFYPVGVEKQVREPLA